MHELGNGMARLSGLIFWIVAGRREAKLRKHAIRTSQKIAGVVTTILRPYRDERGQAEQTMKGEIDMNVQWHLLLLVTLAAVVTPASRQQMAPAAAPANIGKAPCPSRISLAYGVTGIFRGSYRQHRDLVR